MKQNPYAGLKKVILASMILLPLVPFVMETAYTMISQNKRRLTILDSDKVIGIIREQDLFFEIDRILREM
jgi:predicted transcriptional regulator